MSWTLPGAAPGRRSGFFQERGLLRITGVGCRCLKTPKCLQRKKMWRMRKNSEIAFCSTETASRCHDIFSVFLGESCSPQWRCDRPCIQFLLEIITQWERCWYALPCVACSLQSNAETENTGGGSLSQKGASPGEGESSYHLAIIPAMLPSCLSYIWGLFTVGGGDKLYPMWHLQWCNMVSAPRSNCLVRERTRVTGHQVRLSASWSLSKRPQCVKYRTRPPSVNLLNFERGLRTQRWLCCWIKEEISYILMLKNHFLKSNSQLGVTGTWRVFLYSSDILSWVCSSRNL